MATANKTAHDSLDLAYIHAYDAEYHIGLVADDASDATATANRVKLNAAMAAAWPGGSYAFSHGTPGPILKPITFAGKNFYFKGRLQTGLHTGLMLIGTGAGTVLGQGDAQAGQRTCFIRIDADPDDFVILLRYNGVSMENILCFGRRLTGNINSGFNGISAATNANPVAITTVNISDGVTPIAHGYSTGDTVWIFDCVGNTTPNGRHIITVTGSTTFTLNGVAGNGPYTGGGTVTSMAGFGVGIEGRTTGASGKHIIRNCGAVNCNVGLRFLRGYFTDNAITGATNATPIVITCVGHGLVTNDLVQISGVKGNTAANTPIGGGLIANQAVTVLTANTFSINNSVGNGTYTGGGLLMNDGELHADETVFDGVFRVNWCPIGVQCDNDQSVWCEFSKIQMESGPSFSVVLDLLRGGLYDLPKITIGLQRCILLRLANGILEDGYNGGYSPNARRIELSFNRDGVSVGTQGMTMVAWNDVAKNGGLDQTWRDWDIRIKGNIATADNAGAFIDQLLDIGGAGPNGCALPDNIWFDVSNIERVPSSCYTYYGWDVVGPWRRLLRKRNITGATNATPIVITSAAHGYSTGDNVSITGVLGNLNANDRYRILKVNADSFQLVGSVGSGSYTSGGTALKQTIL